MLGRNAKETWAYLLTLTLSTSLLFVFVNLQSDANFTRQLALLSDAGLVSSNYIIITTMIIVIAVICAANCFVANSYFVKAKAQELCVYLSCGMNIAVLAKYLIYQNLILLGVALFGGALLGGVGNVAVNLMMNALIGLQGDIFTMSMNGVALWGIILSIEMIYLILINVGYAYKAELKDLIDENRTPRVYDARFFKPSTLLYVFLSIVGFAILVFVPCTINFMIIGVSISFTGLQGVYHYYLPKRLEKKMLKKEKLQTQTMIVRGNLLIAMKANYLFVIMLFATILFMVCIFPIGNNLAYTGFILCIAYSFIMLVMCLSLILKVILEAKKRKPRFHHLELLGVSKVDIKECIKKEMTSLFGYIIVLPLPFAITIAIRFVQNTMMDSMVAGFLILSYIGLLSITGIICVKCYSENVIDNGGDKHE